jgi:hypothetical protein
MPVGQRTIELSACIRQAGELLGFSRHDQIFDQSESLIVNVEPFLIIGLLALLPPHLASIEYFQASV